jgi:hypothetical protein
MTLRTVLTTLALVGASTVLASCGGSGTDELVSNGSPVVQIAIVDGSGGAVCLRGQPAQCFIAFVEGGTRPVVGARYFARKFHLPSPGGYETAIMLLRDPIPSGD